MPTYCFVNNNTTEKTGKLFPIKVKEVAETPETAIIQLALTMNWGSRYVAANYTAHEIEGYGAKPNKIIVK